MSDASPLVSAEWLAAHLADPGLVVVDASWHMPDSGRSGAKEFLEAHIPGAVFFDIDALSDRASPLPHMLPDAQAFARDIGALGIGDGARIVVYDALGLFSAPRAWWTLQVFGAADVKVLDGGLPAWKAAGLPLESGAATRPAARFTARLDPTRVADISRVEAALGDGRTQVLDARQAARFRGEVPEPRAGLRSGHMPGSLNLPYGQLLKDGHLRSPEEIEAILDAAGLDPSRPVITSCGSGVTAAVLWLALARIGRPPVALYDGSWTEWGGSDKPIATGP